MIIEYAHLYCEDLINGTVDMQALARSVDTAAKLARPGDQLWVLLDDKDLDLSEEDRVACTNIVSRLLISLGLAAERIEFEKRFFDEAEAMIEALPKEYLGYEEFRKQGKRVLFFKQGGRKIPLKTLQGDRTLYSCPLLASLWRKFKESRASETLTILESRYREVEENVARLLKASRYEATGKADYVWI